MVALLISLHRDVLAAVVRNRSAPAAVQPFNRNDAIVAARLIRRGGARPIAVNLFLEAIAGTELVHNYDCQRNQ